jgi:16S rRNA (guanine(527)-N(7))-methyltransferase RsmG
VQAVKKKPLVKPLVKKKPNFLAMARHKEPRAMPAETVWKKFSEEFKPSEKQLEQFKIYAEMLTEWNKTRNLTALEGLSATVNQHFKDSIEIRSFFDFSKVKTVADVGAGAGFPGLPIKIMFPHLRMILIEVSYKRQEFLSAVIDELGLENVEIVGVDWRTYLRKTSEDIEVFVTKAAMDELELARMFRSTSMYRSKEIIYWASGEWKCNPLAEPFIRRVEKYRLGRKNRKFVFMALDTGL